MRILELWGFGCHEPAVALSARHEREKVNGLLCDYFPEGSDLRDITSAKSSGSLMTSTPNPQDPRMSQVSRPDHIRDA
jgi:hypothetical protein